MKKLLTVLLFVGLNVAAQEALAGCGSNTGRNANTTAPTAPSAPTNDTGTPSTPTNGTPTNGTGSSTNSGQPR